MEKDSVLNYSCPIHKSLIQDDVDFGIGVIPAVLIVILTIILKPAEEIYSTSAISILMACNSFFCKRASISFSTSSADRSRRVH